MKGCVVADNSNNHNRKTQHETPQATLAILGINHNTAPIKIRESLAFTPSESVDFLRQCRMNRLIRGGVLLSTCNRMAVIVESDLQEQELYNHLSRFVLEYKRMAITHRRHFEYHTGEEAIKKLFLLGSGYLSMVRGETQILGQIKEAVQVARTSGNTTNVLLRLFDKSYEVAKKIRSSQQVFAVNRSAGASAVELLWQKQGEQAMLQGRHLILGAGQMAVTLVQALQKHGIRDIALYNRTEERAIRFGEQHSIEEVYCGEELDEALSGVTHLWVATSAANPIITRQTLHQTIGHLSIFDLGLPRNVAEEVGSVEGVQLFCIDDLNELSDKTVESNIPEEVLSLVQETTEDFLSWCRQQQIKDVYSLIGESVSAIFQNELQKANPETAEEKALLTAYTEQLTKAYTSQLIGRLRKLVEETQDPIYADLLKQLLAE